MILDYYGVNIRYRRLRQVLQSSEDGTPFDNLLHLTALGVAVTVANEFKDPMALLDASLQRTVPVILAVGTAYLSYWTEDTDHAVVVAGADAMSIALYDPWFPNAPQIVERVHVESAWLESAFKYGVIKK